MGWCCIDRLSWHRIPDTYSPGALDVWLSELQGKWNLFRVAPIRPQYWCFFRLTAGDTLLTYLRKEHGG